MKPARCLFIAVIVSLAFVASGCRQPGEAPEADSPPSTPVPVHAATATVTTLHPSVDLVGAIVPIPERSSDVSTQVAGLIERVLVVEGQAVHAGQTLVQLDIRSAEARLASARAAEQRAQATLTKLEHGPRPEEVEAARQDALQLAAAARALSAKLDALRPLHEKGEVSDVELGQAQATFDAAEAENSAAEARLQLLQAGTRPEEIAAARADLASAQAEVHAAELAVKFSTITSPIDGVVTRLPARFGAYVSPADVLAAVVDTSELFVNVRIPSAYLANTQPKAAADVWVSQDTSVTCRGSVARLGPQADPSSGTVEAFVLIKNTNDVLRPGLACRVRLWLPELSDVLTIPVAAVADRDGTPVVTVIRDAKAYEQPVTLGVSTENRAQVTAGLKAGDLVTTEGGYGLPEGCPVRIVSEEPATTVPETGD